MGLTNKYGAKDNLIEANTLIENGELYLHLAYEFENKDGYFNRVFPRIKLPFSKNFIPEVCVVKSDFYAKIEGFVEDDYGQKHQLNPDENGNLYYERCIERKMTLTEIEKELGYKVNIIEE